MFPDLIPHVAFICYFKYDRSFLVDKLLKKYTVDNEAIPFDSVKKLKIFGKIWLYA